MTHGVFNTARNVYLHTYRLCVCVCLERHTHRHAHKVLYLQNTSSTSLYTRACKRRNVRVCVFSIAERPVIIRRGTVASLFPALSLSLSRYFYDAYLSLYICLKNWVWLRTLLAWLLVLIKQCFVDIFLLGPCTEN